MWDMTRLRAQDYDDKYKLILSKAAALFAEVGYPSVRMQDVAKVCGATKSMLYHYFPAKDDLLLAMLREHLEQLIAGTEAVLDESAPIQVRFDHFVRFFVQKSAQSRQRNVSAMNDVKFLS